MLEWKSVPEDEYEASAAFSENSHYEISTMTLKGKKHLIRLKFPFCHFYQITDRGIFNALHKIPRSPVLESPICKLETSSLITEVIHRAGGVLAEVDLVHFRICAKNLVFDLVLYKNQESDIRIEEVEQK
ncbi:hypothetical protein [Streptococcus taonis]|uniref:Uncharacterized protein n=1 Tax=Streptococcus taonis TaxID=3041623 RepID=A0ABT6PBS8_9STRE|nr:hypothetical protein [Streptococcus sp. ST22-14]MDI1473440.1 hypothetical protein [Streptococcus sp. ST22-14]